MREVRLVVAKEKCRRGMNAFMLFGCGHGIFNILHIVATVTQLLCAFLISRFFFHLYSQLLVFVCSFFSGCSFASLSSVLAVCCVLEAISSFHMEWLLSVHCAHIFRFVKQIEWMRFFSSSSLCLLWCAIVSGMQ